MTTLTDLPKNLPKPHDDGACNQLMGKLLPNVSLQSTQQTNINISTIKGWLVIYCYPMTGQPDLALPSGWDEIPGARGCTPQSCSFRDHFQTLLDLKVNVYGLSTQSNEYQQEASTRLHLPFPLLSDEQLIFTRILNLPVFEINQTQLNKRVTLITFDGVVQHYFYPVFPPGKNVDDVIDWLKLNV